MLDMHRITESAVRPANWRPCDFPDLQGERVIRLDFETTGLKWWDGDRPVGAAFWLPRSGRRGYLPWGHQGGGNHDEAAAKEWFKRELRGVHIDNANTKFDVHIARAWGIDLARQGCTFGDVAHRAALLNDHRFKFGIDQLAKDFIGLEEGKYDLGLRDKGNLWRLSPWAVEPYAIQDVSLVDQLCAIMDPDIVAQDLQRVLALEQDIIPVVVEMESNGAFLDMSTLEQWEARAQSELRECLMRVYRATGVMMDSPDSPKSLLRVFQACKIPITAWTAGGKPSFTGEVLRAIDHPVIKDVLRAAELADLLSKYLTKYLHTVRADGWIRYNLHQLRMGRDEEDGYGTVSGRFSSAGDDHGGINVQQVVSPKKQKDKHWCEEFVIRNLFKPQHGHSWLAVDASQIEYRIFAHFASDPEILGTYGEDVPEEVAKRDKRGRWTDYHDTVQELLRTVKPDIKRKHTKITNFCKLFGSGIIKFAFTLETITEQQFKDLTAKYDISKWQKTARGAREESMRAEPVLQEALSVFDAYDNKFPSAKATLNLAKKTAADRGYVKTIMGRRARFPKKFKIHSALNRIVQGTAADINKRVLVEIYKRREELGLTLRMTVHDEVDADLADPGMLPQIEEAFNRQYVPLKVPILWDCEVGPSWGEAKGKA